MRWRIEMSDGSRETFYGRTREEALRAAVAEGFRTRWIGKSDEELDGYRRALARENGSS